MTLSDIKFSQKFTGTIDKKDWNQKVNSYKVTLQYNNVKHTYNFFQGLGIKENPSIESVLHSLLLDVNSTCYNYDDFINEFGYEDNKQSKSIYKACLKTSEKLDKMFNSNELEELNNLLQDY